MQSDCLAGKGIPSDVLKVYLKVMATQFGSIRCYIIVHLKIANFVIKFHPNKSVYCNVKEEF